MRKKSSKRNFIHANRAANALTRVLGKLGLQACIHKSMSIPGFGGPARTYTKYGVFQRHISDFCERNFVSDQEKEQRQIEEKRLHQEIETKLKGFASKIPYGLR